MTYLNRQTNKAQHDPPRNPEGTNLPFCHSLKKVPLTPRLELKKAIIRKKEPWRRPYPYPS